MARIAESFDFGTENIRFWEPTTQALQQITLAVELRDDKLVRQAVRASLEESSRSLQAYAEQIARPNDFVGIQQDLLNEIQRARKWRHATSGLSRKRELYDEVYHETYVVPLYQAAQSSLDPAARSLLLAMAEISEQLHRSSTLVRAASQAGSRGDDPRSDLVGPIESKARLQLINQLVEIRRELRGRSC